MVDLVKKVPTGGGFFKNKEHLSALALLIEPFEFLEQVPSSNPQMKPQDIIVADVTEFLNKGMLEGKEPPVKYSRVRMTGGGIVNSLKEQLGKALVCKYTMQKNSKPGFSDYPVLVTADDAAIEGVVKYVEKREADEAAAMEDLPDFLK